VALGLGSAPLVPLFILAASIPDESHPVAPLRALTSSIAVMAILCVFFPHALKPLTAELQRGDWKILTFVAFNLFPDAVSLVETRWILQKGNVVSLRSITLLLLLDLALSAAIYLILPGIADQRFDLLRDGILFKGSMP
jgi:hypothetical protein